MRLRGLMIIDQEAGNVTSSQRHEPQTGGHALFPLDNDQFDRVFRGDPLALREFPFYPLGTPMLPAPGPNFVRQAQRMAGNMESTFQRHLSYLYLRALYDGGFTLPVKVGAREVLASFVPGHLREIDIMGPMAADVMIIGKHPGREEVATGRHLVGPSSDVFWDAAASVGFTAEESANWYLTSLVKWDNLNPKSGSLPKDWIKDCYLLLQQELRFVRPKYILCLGSDASNHLLGGLCGLNSKTSGFGVEAMKGRVIQFHIPLHDEGEKPRYHTAEVMTAIHPAAVYRTPELMDELETTLGQFRQLTHGAIVGGREFDIDHRVVYDEETLSAIVTEILEDAKQNSRSNIIAVDAEWHGEHPQNPGAYLRTIQFSHKPKFACCVVLRHAGGAEAFHPGISAVARQLRRLLCRPEARVGGHYFRADLPWIRQHLQLDLRSYYKPPETWEGTRTTGGFDTSLMAHASNETQRFKLEELASRYTSCPRWDVQLAEWRKGAAHELKKKEEMLLGYGECPDAILHPYANYDCDATRRLFDVFDELLERDMDGNNCRRAYWTSHSASLAFLEMEETGLLLDRERTEDMIRIFQAAKTRLVEAIRTSCHWPNFNPDSSLQCCALLFGDRYAQKKNKDGVAIASIRPEGALTLNLSPIVSTGKRPRVWEDIVADGEEDINTPSTDKQVLGILGQSNPVAAQLRDIRFVGQLLKTILRPPKTDEDGEVVLDERTGLPIYEKGLISHSASDGRVHSRLGQHLETGRANSYDPNLQNIPKRREKEYHRIVGAEYRFPIRSVFRAPPGHVLIESDIAGAEVAAIMWLSNDKNGIDHVRRGMLPESHPDYYDIHASQAVKAFRLTCKPTKSGLGKEFKHLRDAAKCINFGVPYGRGAEALARQCREEGVQITTAEAQMLIDAYFQQYPNTYDFLEACKARVQAPQWMCNAFGRYRRFRWSDDRGVIGEMERQAMNFPIQSLVADAMSRALYHLHEYRKDFTADRLWYRIALQIHDAVILEVPVKFAAEVVTRVLPTCMIDRVPVIPSDLDGNPFQLETPYRFGIETTMYTHWGVPLKAEEAEKLGLDSKLVAHA